jgi:hypothetical protein
MSCKGGKRSGGGNGNGRGLAEVDVLLFGTLEKLL